jgi:hypothetical protein
MIKDSINNKGDLTYLGVHCYICNFVGHISVDCFDFNMIKGNMEGYFDKSRKGKHKQESKSNLEEDFANVSLNTMN